MSVNKTIILGNVGKDPEVSYSSGGMAICKFSIATSKKKKDGQEVTSWHRCTAFNKTAEILGQYVKKGDQLYVEGELSYGSYEKDGHTNYTTEIIVNQFSFINGQRQSPAPQQSQGGQSGYQNQGYQNNKTQGQNQGSDPMGNIPF